MAPCAVIEVSHRRHVTTMSVDVSGTFLFDDPTKAGVSAQWARDGAIWAWQTGQVWWIRPRSIASRVAARTPMSAPMNSAVSTNGALTSTRSQVMGGLYDHVS